jgi:hypothetical protein
MLLIMSSNLTRFYYDVDEDCRTGCFNSKVFDDVETIEADAFEKKLKSQDIEYLRVDL